MNKWESLQYPDLRRQLLSYMRELADFSYQEKYWVEGARTPEDNIASFDSVIDFLFDDMSLEDNPQLSIGSILRDQSELAAVVRVIDSLNTTLAEAKPGDEDAKIIRAASWPSVMAAASKALHVLSEPDGVSGAEPG